MLKGTTADTRAAVIVPVTRKTITIGMEPEEAALTTVEAIGDRAALNALTLIIKTKIIRGNAQTSSDSALH